MSQDKDAMEKAAREYADIEDTIELANHRPSVDEYKAFKAGWQSAHSGPKVVALVEALEMIRYTGDRDAAEVAFEALEKLKGK